MLTANIILTLVSNPAMSWASTASRGISIAVTGMLIVACALLLICLFIYSLPKVLASVATVWPEPEEVHSGKKHPESLVPGDDELLAAIGFVLHRRLQDAGGSNSSAQKT